MGYELMDKAIEELNGVLPEKDNKLTRDSAGNRLFALADGQLVRFSSIAFENRAKELGWINGYKYGVEYLTNGKKPDLPDDVLIYWRNNIREGLKVTSDKLSWKIGQFDEVTHFKIIDERYKPKSLEEFIVDDMTQAGLRNNDLIDNSWHKGEEYPPAGTKCEVLNNNLSNPEWEKAVINFVGEIVCVYSSESCTERCARLDFVNFRPIKSERDMFIEAASLVLAKNPTAMPNELLGMLYDADFRAPKTNKEQNDVE